MEYTLGLDIGIGSIGAAIISGNKVEYMGVRIFDSAKEASESRKNRSARRNLSRKKWRKQQLKNAFDDFGVISKSEMEQEGYLCYTTNNSILKQPTSPTVYHLRKKALTEQVSKREMLLCIYNILQARGHFLMETIDFEKDTISFERFADKFFEVTEEIIGFSDAQKKEIKKEILTPLFNKGFSKSDVKNKIDNLKAETEEEQTKVLLEIIKLLAGWKASVKNISESIKLDKEGTVNVTDLKKLDELDPFLQEIVELYDLQNIHKMLSNHNYLCEVAVEKLDEFEKIIKEYGEHSAQYDEARKKIADISVSTKNHYRVIKNIQNNYPNGLYVKEVVAILKKQSEYYPEITDEFIKVCKSIVSARIPYFIGPLNEDAKNAWVTKKGKIKYSYEYSKNDAIDVNKSIVEWKNRMISHCTYLPEEPALPVGSFLGETFNIINELNILKAIDKNGNDYQLTTSDKEKVFNNLFLKQSDVTHQEVADLLDLESFGVRKNSHMQPKFNNKYTLYHSIVKAIPELKVESITTIFNNDKRIEEIENIILTINLYDEEKTRQDYFENECHYSANVAKRLSALKSTSFYSFSKKFICDTPLNKDGESMMSILFGNNTNKFANEQMTIITNAKDKDGNHVDYISNKYLSKIKENDGKLVYSLLMDNGNPTMPISRPVVRALNECMKLYTEIVKVYGVPKRVVIETARDFPDFQEVKERTAKTYDKSKKLVDNILKQLKGDHKKYSHYNQLEDWDDIKDYVNKYKQEIELYITQMGMDLMSGDKIDINHLENYEIDHILPRGFGDNSMNDKMLIAKRWNARKKDRLPLEFIASDDNNNSNHVIIASEYLNRVNALYEMRLISEKKFKILTLESSKDLNGFINQNLVDTRYIIREFMSILRAFNTVNQYDTHIVALKSAYTSLYRNAFRMNKVRDFGDQHHAHDAALLVVADRTLSAYYPNYDSRSAGKSENETDPFRGYQSFVNAMGNQEDEGSKEKLNQFIYYAYKMAFGESYTSQVSVISQIQNIVPFYSQKVEKSYTGQYFDINPLKPKDIKPTDVLTLLGVNNEKKAFSGINCVAVDFYKYTDEKGKKQHVAVHIPRVIVDNQGNINKEKYLTLIKEHYKVPELIDENGELKEGYFRFRAFKNDLIYETNSNVLLKFNIGSIVNKKLECKFVNVFSYNDISCLGRDLAFRFIKKFNIKTKSNTEGIPFKDINKDDLVADVAEVYWHLTFSDKKVQNAIGMLNEEKTLKGFCNHLAYLSLIINRAGTPPTITGQYTPVINSNLIKDNPNAQYVKIKSTILGIRAYTINDGKMIITTPDKAPGQFKKITKESFSWNLKNPAL